MKVACLQENLTEGLSIVSRFASTRSTLPTAQCILLATESGRLKLVATNLEAAAISMVGAQVEEEGAIAVPSRMLSDFVAGLPSNEPVELSTSGAILEIRCGRDRARISGLPADDFPPIPTAEGGPTLVIEALVLRRAIEQVHFAAATDSSRPVLAGIHLLAEGDRLRFAAADGFRLAVRDVSMPGEIDGRLEAILPAVTLRELRRLLTAGEVTVKLNAGQTWARFVLPNAEVGTTLIHGTYPNLEQVLPKAFTTKVTFSLEQFEREVALAEVFNGGDEKKVLRLQALPSENGGPGTLLVSASRPERGGHEGEIEARVEGDAAKIALNSYMIRQALPGLAGKELSLELNTPSSPCLMRTDQDDDYTYVVMPMFVQW